MSTAAFAKELKANNVDILGDLFMNDHASFAGDVDLGAAKIGGGVAMSTASFAKELKLRRVDILGDLFMNDRASFAGDVNLAAAKIGGNLEMATASFAKQMNAENVDVHNDLFMSDHASFAGDVDLEAARIGGDIEMDTSSFAGEVDLLGATIGGDLDMDTSSFAGKVRLSGTTISGDLAMNGASFTKELTAENVDVRGDLYMRDNASFGGDVDLLAAKISHQLDLRSAIAIHIDMSDVNGGEFLLSGLKWRCPKMPQAGASANVDSSHTWDLGSLEWRRACSGRTDDLLPTLILRNAHFETLQDSRDAWPPFMDLEGFRYDRIGGLDGTGRDDMRHRTPEEWIDWLARDPIFSPQPYTQLASVLTAAGRSETAETILYAGREREREEVWGRPDVWSWRWLRHDFPTWLSRTVDRDIIGYGIGTYSFRILIWVIAITIMGTIVLWFSPYARRQGIWWRLGAGLHRLLPVVGLNKEFQDFFDSTKPEPGEPRKLLRWQMAFFAFVALAGWILAAFLLPVLGGLK